MKHSYDTVLVFSIAGGMDIELPITIEYTATKGWAATRAEPEEPESIEIDKIIIEGDGAPQWVYDAADKSEYLRELLEDHAREAVGYAD